MVRLQRILREYREAGSVNSLLALWGFVDDETFLTKAGHIGMVFRLAGVDDECLDEAARRAVVHRLEAALRVLDEHCRLYQYLCKRRIAPLEAAVCDDAVASQAIQERVAFLNTRRGELYEVDLYLVLLYEGIQKRHTRR
jgi:type IV secretory pathway VirB4 component